jgi:UPF0755 protein
MMADAQIPKKRTNAFLTALAVTVLFLPALGLIYSHAFGPIAKHIEARTEFIVLPEDTSFSIAKKLATEGIIKNEWAFLFALSGEGGRDAIRAGGYKLAPDMDLFTIAKTLTDSPALVYVRIPAGFRKEQIADRLATALGWTEGERNEWLSATLVAGLSEGVYFPDVYLIPTDQSPRKIAERMRDRFRDKVKDLVADAAIREVDFSDVLVIASMIEREAAGPHDMGLISGIMWNRLAYDMPLGIDATLQYIRGEEGSWWPVPRSEDKYLESPYNTYFTPGLPPSPIANPSLDSIKAALNPEDTSCYYYLHDYRGSIHCSANYNGHVANINRYLR